MSSELSIEVACSPSSFGIQVQLTLQHGMGLEVLHSPWRLH